MKKLLFTGLLALTFLTALGQADLQNFSGALSRDGSIQLIKLSILKTNDKIEVRYSIPDIGYIDVKSESAVLVNDTLKVRLFYGSFNCFYNKENDEWTGVSQNWEPKIRIHLKKTVKNGKPFSEEPVQFSSKGILIAGTVLKPNIKGKIPYVILIHGSDAQDRETPYYHSLAYNLAEKGIGVLFYDKRGCGKSTGNVETATFDELADDAVSVFAFLEKDSRFQASSIGFLGISQGGWIAPIAAAKLKECAFVILNVGPSVSVFEQDVHRVKYTMMAEGLKKKDIDSAVNYTRLYFNYVRSNSDSDWNTLKAAADVAKTKSWAEYINLPDKNVFAWWRANNYDPASALSTIKCPVLSLMGEVDPLVPPVENEEKMRDYLRRSGVKNEVVVIKGSGHNMLTFQGLNGDGWKWPKAYWRWPRQPEAFLDTIVNFIKPAKDR